MTLRTVLVTLLCARFALAAAGCREPIVEPLPPPSDTWRDTWPVLVLNDPDVALHLSPIEVYGSTWLVSPTHPSAGPWLDPWSSPLSGTPLSARLGHARSLLEAAAAFAALAELDAEALCRLGVNPSSFGADVPMGYLMGVEGCLWHGDADGAAAAWSLWRRFDGNDMLDWPAPPSDITPDTLAGRHLPFSGWAVGSPGPADGPPGAAYRTVYRSRGQDVEYAFVLPGDLARTATALQERAAAVLDGCDRCPADAGAFLRGEVARGGPSCSLQPGPALPLLVGRLPLALAHVCTDTTGAPPAYRAGAAVADLDGELETYLDEFLGAIEALEALPAEAVPTARDLTRRALYRQVGLDAHAAGDNAAAFWALESAVGVNASTSARGGNDPQMVCSLALARFRAGHFRPVTGALDDAGGHPGWEPLRTLARTVARVEAMPGIDSVGVMR